MPNPARTTVSPECGIVHASPRRGENRKGLVLKRLSFQPTVAAETTAIAGFCAAAIAANALCEAVKFAGFPATTKAGPPGAVRSMFDVWFTSATRLLLYSYRRPMSSFKFAVICH